MAIPPVVERTALRLISKAGQTGRILWGTFQVLWNAGFAFMTEEALIRASSLAFTTVVSIVPLVTILLRLMNFYGISNETRDLMERLLAQYLLPTRSQDVLTLIFNAANEVTVTGPCLSCNASLF
jgi:uncharacterized BrkB/YihY/UPF0761 family membrane protein